ncbi:MAG: nuclear transport factor 2 family protein [Opitutae bacterium]|nr:nuclear transport factor 2 family protein [Opitutae bacterium]
MKNYSIRRALFAAGCLWATGFISAATPPAAPDPATAAIEQAVLETNERMIEAANSLDADAFFAYILDSDKGLIIQNGVRFKTRQEALAAVKRGFAGIAKLERRIDDPLITVVSPELAVLTGEGNTVATLADGRVMTRRFAVSLIFQRKDGQWKLLQGHYSMPVGM